MLQFTQITDLITELLLRNDCVIVPNFGGFVARNYSSNFSKGNNVLYPPSKHVLFNRNLIHNDGLLISEVAQKRKISIEESTKHVEDYKNYIQSLLAVKKRFELNNVGLLYIDAEGTLRFEAKVDVNFLLESFGFEPVITNELSTEIEKPLISHFEDCRPSHIPITRTKKSYAKLALLGFGIPVAASFLMFAAFSNPMKPILQSSFNPFFTPEKTYSLRPNTNHKLTLIHTLKKQILLADVNGYATFKLCDNSSVLVASFNDSALFLDKLNVVKKSSSLKINPTRFLGKYQVVMGCFGVEANAKKLIKELNNRGVIASISGKNNKGLTVVSCGGFETKDEANNKLSLLKSEFPNAWILAN